MFLQQLVTGISVGGIYALLATGYSLIYSLLDFSNWAHGEFAMVSAYIAIVLSSFMGMPFVLAAVGIGEDHLCLLVVIEHGGVIVDLALIGHLAV